MVVSSMASPILKGQDAQPRETIGDAQEPKELNVRSLLLIAKFYDRTVVNAYSYGRQDIL